MGEKPVIYYVPAHLILTEVNYYKLVTLSSKNVNLSETVSANAFTLFVVY